MQKWEYRIESSRNLREKTVDVLNQLGEEGWELVTVFSPTQDLYLKRPKV